MPAVHLSEELLEAIVLKLDTEALALCYTASHLLHQLTTPRMRHVISFCNIPVLRKRGLITYCRSGKPIVITRQCRCCYLVKIPPDIIDLTLSKNYIGDHGAATLAAAISRGAMAKVESLQLEVCRIGDTGFGDTKSSLTGSLLA